MIRLLRSTLGVVLAAFLMGTWVVAVLAQTASTPAPAPQTPATETAPPQAPEATRIRYRRPVVRVNQDFTLGAGADASQVLVILGSVTIEGRVSREVIVWLGDVRLGPTAELGNDLLVVAGNVTVDPGAVVDDSMLIVGGRLDAPSTFTPGGEQFLIGTPQMGQGVRALVPWVTRGLLLGRPIVPDLPWVWTIVGLLFIIAVVLNQLFDAPVRAAAEATTKRPFGALLTGVLVMLVAGPLALIVGATIVGLVLLPIVLCVAALAWIVGKVGVLRGLGGSLFRQDDPDSRLQGLRSLILGFAAVTLAYMVPVLGLVTWSLVSVVGLGAATIALIGSVRREYPRAPKAAPQAPPAAPAAEPGGSQAFVTEPASERVQPQSSPPTGLLAFARAGALDRIVAFAIDCVIAAIAVQLFRVWDDGGFFLLLLVYHIVFWAWQGTTLGGIVSGVRLIRTDGSDVRIVDAIVRGLSSLLSFAALGIGLLWMLQDAERQTWHDKIAGTYAVKVPRDFPLR